MFTGIFKRVWFLWALCLIFNIITLFLITHKVYEQPNKISVLHYNVVVGVDWYGPAKHLYQIPVAAGLISILNFIFYRILKPTANFYAPMAAGVTLCIQLIFLFCSILLISVN